MASSKKKATAKRANRGGAAKGSAGAGGAAGKGAGQGQALLWGLTSETEKGAAVRDILANLDVSVKDLSQEQLGLPAGSLVGKGGPRVTKAVDGAVPTQEFIMLCNVPQPAFVAFLDQCKAQGVSVEHKAALTPVNRFWPVIEVMKQVVKEHAVMTGAGGAGASAPAAGGAGTRAAAEELGGQDASPEAE